MDKNTTSKVVGKNRARHYTASLIALLVIAALACSVDFATETTPEDIQTRPLVYLLAPVNNSVYAEGVEVQLYAIAQDPQIGVSRIEFRLNDRQNLGEVTSGNPAGQPSLEARITWTATGKQAHQLIVEAFRTDNSSLGEDAIIITVTDKPTARVLEHDPTAAPLATAAAEATPVPTPTERPIDMGIITGPTARVIVAELNVRQGPDTGYPSVGMLAQNDIVQIVGRDANSSWWAIAYGEGTAWVFASLVVAEGDMSNVPLVAPP